jgi:hypothetical protein
VQSVSLAQIFDLLPVNLLITAPMDLRFEDLSNVWILQIIDDFGKDVPLSAFLDHIMPLLLIAV